MRPKSLRMLVRAVEEWGDEFTPACECGCGEPVPIRVKGSTAAPNKVVNLAHIHYKKWKKPIARNIALGRMMETWGDGFPPPCKCGCGDPTVINKDGVPADYINAAHRSWGLAYTNKLWHERERAEQVSADAFRAALKQLIEKKGVTVEQLAEMAGHPRGTISGYLYKFDRTYVKRSTVEGILRRIAGESSSPTRHQKQQAQSATRSNVRAEQELLYV